MPRHHSRQLRLFGIACRALCQIIREQFVKLYAEHDVLAEVLAEAHRDVGGQKLPSVPEAGGLDIRQVLAAEYAFA